MDTSETSNLQRAETLVDALKKSKYVRTSDLGVAEMHWDGIVAMLMDDVELE